MGNFSLHNVNNKANKTVFPIEFSFFIFLWEKNHYTIPKTKFIKQKFPIGIAIFILLWEIL